MPNPQAKRRRKKIEWYGLQPLTHLQRPDITRAYNQEISFLSTLKRLTKFLQKKNLVAIASHQLLPTDKTAASHAYAFNFDETKQSWLRIDYLEHKMISADDKNWFISLQEIKIFYWAKQCETGSLGNRNATGIILRQYIARVEADIPDWVEKLEKNNWNKCLCDSKHKKIKKKKRDLKCDRKPQ